MDSNHRIMVSKTIALTAWLYPNIQIALFIQPTAIGTVYEDLGGIHEYQLRLAQPTQKGRLQVHALSASYCPSSYPTFSESRAGQSRSLKDCGSILLAVGWLDYIVITSYVSQLVNHFCTRTPMGDLAE